jgi:hypothetical protein
VPAGARQNFEILGFQDDEPYEYDQSYDSKVDSEDNMMGIRIPYGDYSNHYSRNDGQDYSSHYSNFPTEGG